MDGTHHHQRLHEGRMNVAMAAIGKAGTGDSQEPSGMPIYVPREDYPRDNASRWPAFTAPPAYPGADAQMHGAVAVAAEGKEGLTVRGTAGRMPIFVPPEEHKTRPQNSPSRPAFAAPAAQQRARSFSESPIEPSPCRPVFTAPAACPSPDQKPATTHVASGSWPAFTDHQRPTAQVSFASVGSDDATTDSEGDQLPVATRKELAHSSRPASAGPPPTAAAGQSPSARATGRVSTSLEDGARRDDATASQSIPTAPTMAARPSPAAQATPAPGGNRGTAPGENQRKEATFCERLLSCFGLCS